MPSYQVTIHPRQPTHRHDGQDDENGIIDTQAVAAELTEAAKQTCVMHLHAGESLLAASERCYKKPIAVGCRGGGCGVCRVRVLSGDYQCKVMSRTHISVDDQAQGVVLACRVYPQSDMHIEHLPLIKPCTKTMLKTSSKQPAYSNPLLNNSLS